MILINKIVNYTLSKVNLKVTKLSSLKPIKINNFSNIIELDYIGNKNEIVVRLQTEKGRALPIFDFSSETIHPFVLSIKYGANNFNKIHEILSKYYNAYDPKFAVNIFDLKNSNDKTPYWAVVMPWDYETQDEWKLKVESSVKNENLSLKKSMTIKSGWSWIGPAKKNKIFVESQRIYSILKSIMKNGYLRNDNLDGDIRANILTNEEGQWVWQSISGQHRACCLSGLGFKEIPVRINKVIRRSDVNSWPNVVRGKYSKEEALIVFDTIFNSSFNSQFLNEWISCVNKIKSNA
jgi:hypothetical protein